MRNTAVPSSHVRDFYVGLPLAGFFFLGAPLAGSISVVVFSTILKSLYEVLGLKQISPFQPNLHVIDSAM